MFFDSDSVSKDIDNLKIQFDKMDQAINNVESSISNFCSSVKSPTAEYYKSATNKIKSNHDVMLNHFKNVEEYLLQVKQNYDR